MIAKKRKLSYSKSPGSKALNYETLKQLDKDELIQTIMFMSRPDAELQLLLTFPLMPYQKVPIRRAMKLLRMKYTTRTQSA